MKKFLFSLFLFLTPLTGDTMGIKDWKVRAVLPKQPPKTSMSPPLYLANKAKNKLKGNYASFEVKLIGMSKKLGVPPNWLMALFHSESGFDPLQKNKRGSAARGIIQFMPVTYEELGIKSVPKDIFKQMDIALTYLLGKKKEVGNFDSFTQLKLAVLYPVAIKKDSRYVLFRKPTKSYEQNKGLDVDKDGKITVADVEKKMRQDYTGVYRKK